MDCFTLDDAEFPAAVQVSRFEGSSGVAEYHLVVQPTRDGSFATQLDGVLGAYRRTLDRLGLDAQTALLRRFFCSDLVNQAAQLEAQRLSHPRQTDEPCAVSWVGQAPLPPAKVALWAYHLSDPTANLDKMMEDTSLTLRRGGLSHLWTTGIACPTSRAEPAGGATDTVYDQTRGIFKQYDALLRSRGMSLADSCVRTWLFVQNIDANYRGLVTARREFFAEQGLTPDTHFIASTGVQGTSDRVAAKVSMDAYAIAGAAPGQIEYLAALDHLSPTQLYGVTFERGTSLAYRDRKHLIISGTASIDRQGEILYPGDVARQLDRTLENVGALLQRSGATLRDMGLMIVYVRDPGDQAWARRAIAERLGDVPIQVVAAPVCRPGWLIEVEGIAIVPASHPDLPPF